MLVDCAVPAALQLVLLACAACGPTRDCFMTRVCCIGWTYAVLASHNIGLLCCYMHCCMLLLQAKSSEDIVDISRPVEIRGCHPNAASGGRYTLDFSELEVRPRFLFVPEASPQTTSAAAA